jgi:hypothetical protein
MYSPDLAQWKWDVEDVGHDRVDAVLRVLVRHEFHAGRHLDANNVGAGFRRFADDHREASGGGNAGKGCQSMSSGRIDRKTAWPG